MAISVDQFTRQLADSSLLVADDMQALLAALPEPRRPAETAE